MMNPQREEMEAYIDSQTQQYDLVVLFGSYARAQAYSQSDYDILIVDDEFDGWAVYETADAVSFEWPDEFQELHLICCSHSEFTRRYEDDDEMVEEICREGVAIHPQFGLTDYF